MTIEEIKQKINMASDRLSGEIITAGKQVLAHPELGYKEEQTSRFVQKQLSELGIPFQPDLAITGVKGRLKGRRSLASVCIMGELDAVVNPHHPHCDLKTGAAHACGHNAQIAHLLGAARILKESGVMDELDGDAVFLATPAEECIEIGFRARLRDDGKIRYYGGKQELIRVGAFDDIDIAMMVHALPKAPEPCLGIHGSSLGFVNKTVRITGQESHAGAAPFDGINALNAASAALMCVNAQRETFKDSDKVRFHCIFSKAGDIVNVVPADVEIEACVRAGNTAALSDAIFKVDRALKGAVAAFGADIEIVDVPGYLPLVQDYALGELFAKNSLDYLAPEQIDRDTDMFGSTDAGDVSQLLPCIQPVMGGFSGSVHGRDFLVSNDTAAYVLPARLMALTLADLLWNGAEKALEIKNGFKPSLTKTAYLALLDSYENNIKISGR